MRWDGDTGFQALLGVFPQPAFIVDADLALIWWNDAFSTLCDGIGTMVAAREGDAVPLLAGPLLAAFGLQVHLAQAFAAPRFGAVTSHAGPIAGTDLSYAWQIKTLELENRRLAVCSGHDITAHETALRAALAEKQESERSRAALESAMANLSDGLAIMDRDERLVLLNDRMKSFYPGVAAGPVVGEKMDELIHASLKAGEYGQVAEDHDQFVQGMMDDMRNGRSREQRFADDKWAIVSSARMPSGGLLSLWTDITELKKANQALWAARLAAEEASRAKSTFLAHMSHEFRTPLNAIIGFSELITMQLYGPVENERYLEYLNNIASSAQHLHELVSAVLDISRLEAGKLSLRPQAISTWDISHDVLSLLPTNRAHWPRINVRGAAPDILVQIDRVSIRQALLNLLTNAIKASKATDEVWMEFRVTDRLIEFEVGDTGCGLSEQEVAAILQPFGQVHNRPEVARAERGIGLGVPITNGIAEAHGGALRYVTAPGKGTRAIISIPVQAAAA